MAHTSKCLEAIVYGYICRNLELHSEERFGYGPSNFPSAPFAPMFTLETNNVWAAPFIPQLMFAAHFNSLPLSALKYVRTLGLSVEDGPHHPGLVDLIPSMTSLQDVVLDITTHVTGGELVASFALVFDTLAKHKNHPRVHVNHSAINNALQRWGNTCKLFELEWAQLKTLNVVTLKLSFGSDSLCVPKSFFDMIRGFQSLKNLFMRGFDPHKAIGSIPRGYLPLTHVLDFLGEFPDLEHFEFIFCGTQLKLPPNSRVTHLTASIDNFTALNNKFEMFDNITHLQIIALELEIKVLPNFRNLTTLALDPANGMAERLLDHFVANNPKLVNLYLLSFSLSAASLKRVLKKIERLYIANLLSCELQTILSVAPNLCELFLTCMTAPDRLAQVLSLEWLADAVTTETAAISPSLELVQISLVGDAYRNKSWSFSRFPVTTLRSVLAHRFPPEALEEVILPVFSVYTAMRHWPKKFVIHLGAMAKWGRLGRAGT